jgi:initiation factor 1A
MVKNTTGGTGTKSFARKHQTSSHASQLVIPTSPLEQIACVTKALGNGMLEVHTNDDTRLIAHIRNKFRGKQKRHNMISVFAVVLIGLREWETPYKNCDILTIYDANQVEQLKNIPSLQLNHVIRLSLGNTFTHDSKAQREDVVFTEDYEEIEVVPKKDKVGETFKLEDVGEIDFDDI